MHQPRADARLVDEHLREGGVLGEPGQHSLDRDLAGEAFGADRRAEEYLGHAASAEPRVEAVFAEQGRQPAPL
jgi:hypothetical protein